MSIEEETLQRFIDKFNLRHIQHDVFYNYDLRVQEWFIVDYLMQRPNPREKVDTREVTENLRKFQKEHQRSRKDVSDLMHASKVSPGNLHLVRYRWVNVRYGTIGIEGIERAKSYLEIMNPYAKYVLDGENES